MSIRNFPLIPKIILRKSTDQAKAEKKSYSELENLISLIFEVFDVLLRGATLELKSHNHKKSTKLRSKSYHFDRNLRRLIARGTRWERDAGGTQACHGTELT